MAWGDGECWSICYGVVGGDGECGEVDYVVAAAAVIAAVVAAFSSPRFVNIK